MEECKFPHSRQVSSWLRLRHCKDISQRVALHLVREIGAVGTVFEASDEVLQQALQSESIHRRDIERHDENALKRDLDWLGKSRERHVVHWGEASYPALLREIQDPPLLLYVAGDPGLLGSSQLAIVGSRNPTPTGRELAFRFASNLARFGLTVTSGLATGIDGEAHRGAIAATGHTIAIVAHGLDRVYPARHRALARNIGECGALASECPIGTVPTKAGFPRRNRIISGLSVGTLVVEATRRSGSLITARLAGEQGREVFAIPGSVLSPLSRGCHRLIQDGARLVETEADIIEELGYARPVPERGATAPATTEDSLLTTCMGYDPVTLDVLIERTGLTPETVSSMLLRMELEGTVKTMAGGHYVRSG